MIFPSDFFEKVTPMNDKIILEGAISVKAAVEAGNRDVFRIYTDNKKVSRDF